MWWSSWNKPTTTITLAAVAVTDDDSAWLDLAAKLTHLHSSIEANYNEQQQQNAKCYNNKQSNNSVTTIIETQKRLKSGKSRTHILAANKWNENNWSASWAWAAATSKTSKEKKKHKHNSNNKEQRQTASNKNVK